MDFPSSGNNEFDEDITKNNPDSLGEEPAFLPVVMMYMEMHESFRAMRAAGFTEIQALRFHAYCTVLDGEL